MTEFMEQNNNNNALLVEAEIKFNNVPINFDGTIDLCLTVNQPTFFGIIDIRVNESPITIIEQTINIAIDCSGSMSDNMAGSIEQILVLSMFCRKVNIPFHFIQIMSSQILNKPYSYVYLRNISTIVV